MLALAERDLILGLVEWSQFLADVIDGTSTEGLLASFPMRFDADAVSTVVLGGLLNPSNFAPNPDGLSTALSLFQSTYSREDISDPESVYLLTGNFSTDSPALDFSLSADEAFNFDALSFGNLSELIAVPEDVYNLSLLDASPGKNRGRVLVSNQLDLTGKAGEIVALYATGFMEPAANGGGPGLGILAASGDGDVLADQPISTETPEAAHQLNLSSVYPNPLSTRGTITYEIPSHQHVNIDVYDLLGRHVYAVVNEGQAAGLQQVSVDVTGLGSGLYLLRLVTGKEVVTRKLTVVR